MAVLLSAYASSRYEGGAWLAEAIQAAWSPPAWWFALSWTVFYGLQAISASLLWHMGHPQRFRASAFWLAQLALLPAWAWLLFGLNRTGWALAAITLCVGMLGAVIRGFHRQDGLAASLLLPCLAWLAFFWMWVFLAWRGSGGGLGLTG
jgi:tryptophan-rich sensory protein